MALGHNDNKYERGEEVRRKMRERKKKKKLGGRNLQRFY
jgi:hypothetical protein